MPYRDTVGKLTIGVGRNLDDVGISELEAELMLTNDVNKCIADVKRHITVFNTLNDARQAVLVNMCFNLGISGLLKFKRFIAAVNAGEYLDAAIEMLDSKWANQVGYRATELSKQMKTGEWQ